MYKVGTQKTRVGVVYACSLKCGLGGGRDFMIPIDSDIKVEIDEKCPACEVGLLVLDVDKSWDCYQTDLKAK